MPTIRIPAIDLYDGRSIPQLVAGEQVTDRRLTLSQVELTILTAAPIAEWWPVHARQTARAHCSARSA